MCMLDPVSMGIMSLVGTVGSAVLGGVGAVQQANAQNAMAEYNARVAENNAKATQAEADRARQQGWRNANEKRKETARAVGAMRARMGASGAVVDTGSFLDSTMAAREDGEISAMGLAEEGDMTGWRLERERDNYLQNANLSRAGKVSTGSVLAGSILGGMAQTGDAYFNLKGNGVFDSTPKKATSAALKTGAIAGGISSGGNSKKYMY